VRAGRWAALAVGVAYNIGTADAALAARFDVPAGSLAAVASAIGIQAGITVSLTDPSLATRRSPGVRGTMPVREALARALRGTGAEPVFYDVRTVRIIARRAALVASSAPAPSVPNAIEADGDIVVMASKLGLSIDHYPGSVRVVELDPADLARGAGAGTAALTRAMPILGSTNLGPARNKLFIRGIADSSFNGPTQGTVGQYLGDVRLNYNAPDPNLNLYDMKRVEILVGPQGTLYGASSLGGVVRLVPNPPDARNASATATAGYSSTRFGRPGTDGAFMINVPVVDGKVAFRLVGFANREGGYIDDSARGLKDINRTDSIGQRFTLRFGEAPGWTVDLGVAIQNSNSRDGQYALRGEAPLTRRSAIAQPFGNDYYLFYLAARGMIGASELVSTTSAVRHELRTVYDATGYDGTVIPARYEENNFIILLSHETRLSGGTAREPWVIGATSIYNASALVRSLGPLDPRVRVAGVVNEQLEAALFGQYANKIGSNLTATLGTRLTFANRIGRSLEQARVRKGGVIRNDLRLSSTAALDWHPARSFSAFAHYQQGYRAGGLAVTPAGTAADSQRFAADTLDMGEIGIRLGRIDRDPLSLRAALFRAGWDDIQADLIDARGLPYTANIGRGRIIGIDGEIGWRPLPALTVTMSGYVSRSRLVDPAEAFADAGSKSLPGIAGNGGRVAAVWRGRLGEGVDLSTTASLRYVGRSKLGIGSLLAIPQGDYLFGDVGARIDFGPLALSLDIANIGDVRANSFAFGNPFSLAQRDQITPLRPRTIRLGIDRRF
jgi:iron complex outermembrane receptor protein